MLPSPSTQDPTAMMFMLSYQLRSEDPAALEKLEAAIKKLGNWSQRIPGLWLVESKTNAPQIRDYLKGFMGGTDQLFVARISKNWAGRNMGDGFPEWIQRRDFGAFGSTD